MYALEVEQLGKTFRTQRGKKVVALKGLTLSIGQGEIFGFLGPNGAGKSTTIKLIMGLIRPTSGTTRILGVDSQKVEARKNVGFLPENPALYDYLTADQYLGMVGKIVGMGKQDIQRRSDDVLERLELLHARKRPIRGFSKGMVQRLALGQALLHEPSVLILDEPMSGLDPMGRALVKEIILELKEKGCCVFFSTHITSDVETVCDRVAILNQGTLQKVYQVSDLMLEGVHGYRVQYRNAEATDVQSVESSPERLEAVLAELRSSNCEVLLVEPVRKSLEETFLDVVGRS